MATPTVQLGRLTLREEWVITEALDAAGQRTGAITGQEARPRVPAVALPRVHDDLLGMAGRLVPITFTVKNYLDGFYTIADVSTETEDWAGGLAVVRWTMNVQRVGPPAEVDLESRLSGAVTRTNAFAATGERTHAPPVAAAAYWAGTSAPGSVDRPCSDGGSVRVYRTLGAAVNPRWAIAPAAYGGGRVRLLDETGRERAGTMITVPASGAWQLTNGVLRVQRGAGTTLAIGVWDAGVWQDIAYNIQIDSPYTTVDPFDYLTVLVNEYAQVTVRLMKSLSPGRFSVDLTLRRGSRLVELYLQHEYGTQMRVLRSVAATSTQTSGYVVANANDAAGNKSVLGSALAFTANTVTGGVEKTGTATLDVMIGTVLDGSGAIAGDTAADLYAQYLGAPGEVVRGVKR